MKFLNFVDFKFLALPDFNRAGFFFQGAMTTEQIKNAELTSQDIVSRNMPVFAKEVSLAMAKDIQGLRAIFEEVSIIGYNHVVVSRKSPSLRDRRGFSHLQLR